MNKVVEMQVSVELTPSDIDDAIWGMDSIEQAFLMRYIAQRYNVRPAKMLMQLRSAVDDFNEKATEKEKHSAIHFFEEVVSCLKDE